MKHEVTGKMIPNKLTDNKLVNVQINPKMIELARQSRGYSQTELAGLIGFGQSNLSKIEKGILPVSDEILNKLSETLFYPKAFFFGRTSIYPAVSFHRKRESLAMKTRESIQAQINIIKMHIEEFLKSVELVERLPDLSALGYTPKAAAQKLRHFWKVPNGPIDNLTQLIEDNGGIVVYLDLESLKIDGISMRAPNLPPLIFLNKNMPADRMRFTLSHELGHAVLHELHTTEMESEADQFAAEFLMPSEFIKRDLQYLTLRKLAELKKYWKVSMAALVRRAKDLEVISDNQSQYLYIQLARLGYKINEPISFDAEKPQLLKTIVKLHINELGYTLQELADVTTLFEEEFIEKYIDRPNPSRLKLVLGKKE